MAPLNCPKCYTFCTSNTGLLFKLGKMETCHEQATYDCGGHFQFGWQAHTIQPCFTDTVMVKDHDASQE